MDERLNGAISWVTEVLGRKPQKVDALSNDASPRRYFALPNEGIVLVDTPLPAEQNQAFIVISRTLLEYQLHVPQVFRYDLQQGYMLISDLGRRQYLSELCAENVELLYGEALDALHRVQTIPVEAVRGHVLAHFDNHFIFREGMLFQEWFVQKYLQIPLNTKLQQAFQKLFSLLTLNAIEQPQVFVHRDYHSRNLMLCAPTNPGIIDFQDAVLGPITYDLVSLIRDCYIAWPKEQVERWVHAFYQRLKEEKQLNSEISEQQFMQWFDLMGVQRHLKAIGIFARLDLLYKKPDYLKEIPRTLGYVVEVVKKYPELVFLKQFIEDQIFARLHQVSA